MLVVPISIKRERLLVTAYFASIALAEYNLIVNKAQDILHPSEGVYFKSLRYINRRKSYLLGRYVSKKVISHYIKENNLTSIEISSGIFGQPIVQCNTNQSIGVSISHNDSYAIAIAFPNLYPMSIDIENVKEHKTEIIKSLLTNKEQQFVKRNDFTEDTYCTILWTAKEALSKVLNCGLMIPFKLLEIQEICCTKNRFSSTFTNFPQYNARSWIVRDQIISIVLPFKSEIENDDIDFWDNACQKFNEFNHSI